LCNSPLRFPEFAVGMAHTLTPIPLVLRVYGIQGLSAEY
jgi:hypothetical protein